MADPEGFELYKVRVPMTAVTETARPRIDYKRVAPEVLEAMQGLEECVYKGGRSAGLERSLLPGYTTCTKAYASLRERPCLHVNVPSRGPHWSVCRRRDDAARYLNHLAT
jgi:hypothetical protein